MDMKAIIDFFTNPDIGAAASVIGVIITVTGFGFTIYGVWRAKRAAQEARDDIKTKQQTFDLSTSIAIIEEIRRLHREKAWTVVQDRYTALKKSLVAFHCSNPTLKSEHKEMIAKTIKVITTMDSEVERKKVSGNLNIEHLNRLLSESLDELNSIQVFLAFRGGK